MLIHYRKELQEYGLNLRDEEAIKHLVFALKYMYKTLESEIFSYYNLVEISSTPSIDFLNLWMVFRSGDYIFTKTGDSERVLRFEDMSRCQCPIPWCYNRRWTITAKYIDYDGTDFGECKTYFYVRHYEGYVFLKDLKVMPLQYHPDPESVIVRMVERGNKFISLHGKHHRAYAGIAEALSPDRRTNIFGEEDEFPIQSTLVRIIHDVRYNES